MDPFENKPKKPRNPAKAMAFGVLVLLFGMVLLLRNMDLLSGMARDLIFSWEMLIIVIGVLNIFDRARWFGYLLICIGGFFLLTRAVDLPFSLHQIFWPGIFIVMGLFLIFGRQRRIRDQHLNMNISSGSDEFIDVVSIFGGGKRLINSQNFRGGKITTIFGGSEVNLLNAKLSEGKNEIEIVCLFGGTEIIVPCDWDVRIEVANILGGTEDKGIRCAVDTSRTLVLKGVVMFGGCEVKRY